MENQSDYFYIFLAKISNGLTRIAVSQDCKDSFTAKGYIKTLDDCGQACFGLSSTVFTYGKTDARCTPIGCKCFCFHTPKKGKCEQVGNSNYDIYRFNSGKLTYTETV